MKRGEKSRGVGYHGSMNEKIRSDIQYIVGSDLNEHIGL
jgi:hypothetical protein